MKRSSSQSDATTTPKKRRKQRPASSTSSPAHDQKLKSPNLNRARAAAELFQGELQKPSTAPNGSSSTLGSAALVEPAEARGGEQEKLHSVIQKISSTSKEESSLDDLFGDEPSDIPSEPGQGVEKQDERASTEALSTQNATADRPATPGKTAFQHFKADVKMKNVQDDDGEVEVIGVSQRGSGNSADDAMEVDSSPSKQLHLESQSQQNTLWGGNNTDEDKTDNLGTNGKPAFENAIPPRGNTEEKMADGDDDVDDVRGPSRRGRSPPAENNAARRLLAIETLIAPDLAKIPKVTWRGYHARLLRLCRGDAVEGMGFRERLEPVKEIVYLPEELELLRKGDQERMACAVRVCAAAAEVMGGEDEVVPEEMGRWVAAQLADMKWKVRVTSVWRKYWPVDEEASRE